MDNSSGGGPSNSGMGGFRGVGGNSGGPGGPGGPNGPSGGEEASMVNLSNPREDQRNSNGPGGLLFPSYPGDFGDHHSYACFNDRDYEEYGPRLDQDLREVNSDSAYRRLLRDQFPTET